MSKAFIEASSKEEEMKSSSLSFIVVGILVIVLLVLVIFDIIPIAVDAPSAKIFYSIVFGAIAIVFFVVAVISNKKASKLLVASEKEEKLTEEIINYCLKNYTESVIDSEDESDIFFIRENAIKELISEEYKGLDESYLDFAAETVYDEIYSENTEEETEEN